MYETEHDLEHEESARLKIVRALNCDIHKLPISYNVDWVGMIANRIQFWAEYKYRNHDFGRFKSVILSCNKYERLSNLGRAYNVPAMFFVSFNGDLKVFSLPSTFSMPVKWGGRTTKQRRAADVEPVVLIPTYKFHKVGL